MGGCTLTVIRDTREEAMNDMKPQITSAAYNGLWPDSELVVLQEGAEAAEIYAVKVLDVGRGCGGPRWTVEFTPVETGRAFHVGVAARYTRTLKKGEWVATVHVHS